MADSEQGWKQKEGPLLAETQPVRSQVEQLERLRGSRVRHRSGHLCPVLCYAENYAYRSDDEIMEGVFFALKAE